MKFPDLKPSDFKERIRILSPARTADGLGGYTETWGNRGEIWCSIKPVDQENPLNRYRVFTRQGISIFRKYRILWRGEAYRLVTSPQGDEGGKWMGFVIEAIKEQDL